MTSSPHAPARYIDPASGATYAIDVPRWRSDTGGPLMITPLPGIGRDDIDRTQRSLWRYAAALAVRVEEPVTLGGCPGAAVKSFHDPGKKR